MPGGVCPPELLLWLAGRRPGPCTCASYVRCAKRAPPVVAADPTPGEPSCPSVQHERKTRCLAVPETRPGLGDVLGEPLLLLFAHPVVQMQPRWPVPHAGVRAGRLRNRLVGGTTRCLSP